MRAPLAVAAAGLMSCGSLAATGLHPAIPLVLYGLALALLVLGGMSRPPGISPGAAAITAVASLVVVLGVLATARIEAAPLTLLALIPLTVIGMVLIRGHAPERVGAPILALALIVAFADRQVFAPEQFGRDLVLALGVALLAATVAFWGRWRPALYALVLLGYALAAASILEVQPYRSDAVAATHGAADLLIAGRHPYADFNMIEQLDRFGIPIDFATHLEDGTSLLSFNYPALAFLLPAPFVAAGLDDVRLLYLAEILVLLALVSASAREPWRPYALAAGIGGIMVMRQYVVAGVDPAWALLLVTAWLSRKSRASGALLGLAVSVRQTAWPVAPLILLWTWRRYGIKEAALRAAISALVALALHLPFLATDPAAVIGGITQILVLPVERGGIGLSALAGPLMELPRIAHFTLAAVAFGALLWAYGRGAVVARSALALAPLPLFLSYRALQSYFALAPLLLLIDEGASET